MRTPSRTSTSTRATSAESTTDRRGAAFAGRPFSKGDDITTTDEQRTEAVDASRQPPPRLVDGTELIGQYEDSGFKNPPYVVRRADGQVVQLPALLFGIAEEVDGKRGLEELAEAVGQRFKRNLSAQDVQFLIDEKLRPLGLLAQADGSDPEFRKLDPLLALRFKAAIVPDRAVRAVTSVFYPLFFPPVVVAMLAGLVALDVWLFGIHGVGQSARELLYQPAFMLMVIALVVTSAAFHECGHATACRYGGAKPGVMGAGVYIVWPAFYTDVTDAYRLGKWGRLRTDLGGVYFNVIFCLATAAAYFITGFEPLLVVILLQHIEIVHQFLPFLRLDGYYIISDLTGVPDMFQRIRPTLASLIPGRKPDERVTELKPWVRVATTAYVLTLVPVLAVVFGFMLVSTPRIFATAWDSLFVQSDRIGDSLANGQLVGTVAGGVQMVFLVLPAAGVGMGFITAGRRLLTGAWNWSSGAPARRAAVVVGTAAAVAGLGALWWPNGEYRPIQPGERGTLTGAVKALAEVPTGRPTLTEKRKRELGGAPTERARNDEIDRSRDTQLRTPTGTNQTPTTSTPTQTTTTSTTTSTEPTPAPSPSPSPSPTPSPAPSPSPTPTSTTTTPTTTTTTPTTGTTTTTPTTTETTP